MIDRPGLRLTLQGADHFEVRGPLADRAAEFARRLFQALGHPGDPPCRIQIESAPPEHVGLGTGTQLGLAVASALHPLLMTQPALRGGEFLGESRVALASGEVAVADDRDFASPEARLQSRPPNTSQPFQEKLAVEQLAQCVGRGARSAIGTHGFASGGLIFEQGKLSAEAVSPLVARVELPEQWRFVLFWPDDLRGLSGDEERDAFRHLHAISAETTHNLMEFATQEILPAAAAGDVQAFGDALYRYGHEAGMCFAQHQHGAFASARVAALVDAIRKLGISGVGQSSWGPTVYAVTADEDRAVALVRQLQEAGQIDLAQSMIVSPNHRGAKIDIKRS